jgi:hypothetical protein
MAEKNFLEYQPKIDLKREIIPQLTDLPIASTGTTDEANDQLVLDELKQFLQEQRVGRSRVSPAILEALQITPLDVFEALTQAHSIASTLVDNLIASLQGKLAIGPSIDDYIQGRAQQDLDIMSAFEQYHALDINGNTVAEVVPLMLNLRDELDLLTQYANEQLFNGDANMNDIKALRAQEQVEHQHLIQLDKTRSADLSKLSEGNHFKHYLHSKAEASIEFMQGLTAVLNKSLDDHYGGALVSVITAMVTNSSILDSVQSSSDSRFNTHAANSEDAQIRLARTVSTEDKLILLDQVSQAQALKLKNEGILKWIEQNNPKTEDDPMNIFYFELVEGIIASNNNCDLLVQDLYKMIQIEEIQLGDYVTSLDAKKASRETFQTVSNLKEGYDFNNKDTGKQVAAFLRNQK